MQEVAAHLEVNAAIRAADAAEYADAAAVAAAADAGMYQ